MLFSALLCDRPCPLLLRPFGYNGKADITDRNYRTAPLTPRFLLNVEHQSRHHADGDAVTP